MRELSHETLGQFSSQLIASVLELLDVPFFLLDGEGRIETTSARAEVLLSDGRHVVRGEDGRLNFRSALARDALASFLASRSAKLDTSVVVESPDGAPPLQALMRLVCPPSVVGVTELASVPMVVLRAAGDDAGLEAARRRYGFSQAETQVVGAIIAGQSAAEYARRRGLSVHTVRKQLYVAMRKAGVSRQLHLAMLIDGGQIA